MINNVDEKIDFDTTKRYNTIDLSKYLNRGMNCVKFHYPEKQGANKAVRLYIELVGKDDRIND